MNHSTKKDNLLFLLCALLSYGSLSYCRGQDGPWGDLLMRGFERKAVFAKTWVIVFTKKSEMLAFSTLPYKGFGNTFPSDVQGTPDLCFQLKIAMDVDGIFFQGRVIRNESPDLSAIPSIDWGSSTSVMRTLPSLFDEFLKTSKPYGITIPLPLDSIETIRFPPPIIQDQNFIQISPGEETRDLIREMTNLTLYYANSLSADSEATYNYDADNTEPLSKEEITSIWNNTILQAFESHVVEIDFIEDKGIAVFNFQKSYPMELWMSFSLRKHFNTSLTIIEP